jgi:hypothetical protein
VLVQHPAAVVAPVLASALYAALVGSVAHLVGLLLLVWAVTAVSSLPAVAAVDPWPAVLAEVAAVHPVADASVRWWTYPIAGS